MLINTAFGIYSPCLIDTYKCQYTSKAAILRSVFKEENSKKISETSEHINAIYNRLS